jgi:hypothetical protein
MLMAVARAISFARTFFNRIEDGKGIELIIVTSIF